MAKGNLFQGMARGKIGDVVFYRMNGVQMSRVRNRTPKNPRSNEQMYQRAIIATVMKLYSAGKEIFDHSFQGYTVGEGCMRRFNSVNARILRNQVIEDINMGLEVNDQKGRVVPPRSLYYTPINGAQVSEGTLVNDLYTYVKMETGNPIEKWQRNLNREGMTGTDVTVEQLFAARGIYAGDIFTFVTCLINTKNTVAMLLGNNTWASTQRESALVWTRFTVKSNIPSDLTIQAATISQVFDIETSDGPFTVDPNTQFQSTKFDTRDEGWAVATECCIRSRNDVDLRSTEYMKPIGGNQFGITSSYLLDYWAEMVTKIGESELILEGGDGTNLGAGGRRSIEDELIIDADVNEAEVPTTARHRGTRNNSK